MKPSVNAAIAGQSTIQAGHLLVAFAVVLAGMFADVANWNLFAADSISSNTVHELRMLSSQAFLDVGSSNCQAAFTRYCRLMTNMPASKMQVVRTNLEETILLRVAREASVQPYLLNELIRVYGTQKEGARFVHVSRPERLQEKHLTEAYRPAWEALLLAPSSTEVFFMQQNNATITEALSRIGNIESLPVLELAFALTCDKSLGATDRWIANARRFQIMESMKGFATQEALQAMLRCYSKAEATFSGQILRYDGLVLSEWMAQLLS